MNPALTHFLAEHATLTRRYFLRCGSVGAIALTSLPLLGSSRKREVDMQEMIEAQEEAKVRCDFCAERYVVGIDRLAVIRQTLLTSN